MESKEVDIFPKVIDILLEGLGEDVSVHIDAKPNGPIRFHIIEGSGVYGDFEPVFKGENWELYLGARHRVFFRLIDDPEMVENLKMRINTIVKTYGDDILRRLVIYGDKIPIVVNSLTSKIYKSRADFHDHYLRSNLETPDIKFLHGGIPDDVKIVFFRWSSDGKMVVVFLDKTALIQAYISYDYKVQKYVIPTFKKDTIMAEYFNDFVYYDTLDDILDVAVKLGYKKYLPVYKAE